MSEIITKETIIRADFVEAIAALEECASDLEDELDHRYQARHKYPFEMRKWERDMGPVIRARSIASELRRVWKVEK